MNFRKLRHCSLALIFLFAGNCIYCQPIAKAVGETANLLRINVGKILYHGHCYNCHLTTSSGTGKALQRIREYRTFEYIYSYIMNPAKVVSENPEAKRLVAEAGSMMPAFPQFSKEQIRAMLDYLDSLPFDSNKYSFRKNWKKL